MRVYRLIDGTAVEITQQYRPEIVEPTYTKVFWINDRFEHKPKESWQSQGKRKKKPVR